jgi:hypothetical protein
MKSLAASDSSVYLLLDRTHPDFAVMPIAEACNWGEFAAHTDLEQWYQVVFRSTRKEDADGATLEALGETAKQDASQQPGYLFYFKGNVDAGSNKLKNMSFCMWRSRADAEAAAGRPTHQAAIKGGVHMYDEYVVERYDARIRRDDKGASVEFAPLT